MIVYRAQRSLLVGEASVTIAGNKQSVCTQSANRHTGPVAGATDLRSGDSGSCLVAAHAPIGALARTIQHLARNNLYSSVVLGPTEPVIHLRTDVIENTQLCTPRHVNLLK